MKETFHNKIIYIIDDDPIFQFSVQHLIKRIEPKIKTFIFSHGKAAMDYLKQPFDKILVPDIIFLDLNMPVMNGWNFLQNYYEIKRDNSTLSTAIYLVSIIQYQDEYRKAKQNNLVTDFLMKPLTFEKLKPIITH